MDHIVGDYRRDPSRREERATIYGAAATECLTLLYADAIDAFADETEPQQRAYAACFRDRMISLRETIGGLGRRISQGGTLSDEAHEDGTANCLE